MGDVAEDMKDMAMRWAYESTICEKHGIRHLEDEPCMVCEDGEERTWPRWPTGNPTSTWTGCRSVTRIVTPGARSLVTRSPETPRITPTAGSCRLEYFEDNFAPLESAPQDPRVEFTTEQHLDTLKVILQADEERESFSLSHHDRAVLADLLSRLDAVGEPVAKGFVEREELEAFLDPWPLDHSPGMTLWADDDDEYADMIPVELYRRQGGEDE